MMKKHSSVGFLGSVLFHGAILLAVLLGIKSHDSANGFSAPVIDTQISMEMLMATTIETPEPEPQPESEPEPEIKEEVPDPTVAPKPEPPKEKPKEKKKEKPKEKVKPKVEKKPVPTERPKADKVVEGNAAINSQATSTGNTTSNNPNLTGSGSSGSEIDAYRSALRREIERNKRYPQRAKMMRKQGIVQVSFTLGNDGALNNPKVVNSSGNEDLDNAALQAVQQARSIGSPPAGLGRNITVPVSFKIQ